MSEIIEKIKITMPDGEIRNFAINNLPFTTHKWVNHYIRGLYFEKNTTIYLDYNGSNWYLKVVDDLNNSYKILVTNGGFVILSAGALGNIYAIIRPLPVDLSGSIGYGFSGTEYAKKAAYTPAIAAYLAQEKNLQSLSGRIYQIEQKTTKIQFTDNDVVNNCIVEMFEDTSASGAGRNFKKDNGIWYYYSNYAFRELQDGLNVFKEASSGVKSYIIWKGISAVPDGSYYPKTLAPAIDISYSPSIATYIATEKLIEDKLSSITNQ